MEPLGGTWTGERALAIAIHAALSQPEPETFVDALAPSNSMVILSDGRAMLSPMSEGAASEEQSPWAAEAVPPPLKWPGGKSQELGLIRAAAPQSFNRLVEPFLGGGSVSLARSPEVPSAANDISPDLVNFFQLVREPSEEFIGQWRDAAQAWDSIRVPPDEVAGAQRALGSGKAVTPFLGRFAEQIGPTLDVLGIDQELCRPQVEANIAEKWMRIQANQAKLGRPLSDGDLDKNLETALRASVYYQIRRVFNAESSDSPERRAVIFWIVRELAYASMFRYNRDGEFNVPYGGISYNRKSLSGKVEVALDPATRSTLRNMSFSCGDFEAFLVSCSIGDGDFIFVDPPYDTAFSAYEKAKFEREDQRRLAGVLREIHAPVLIVIKQSALISEIYGDDYWHIEEADKTYSWTIKGRNNRETKHLVIRNYGGLNV